MSPIPHPHRLACSQPAAPRFDIHRHGDPLIHAFAYAGANAGALKPLAAQLPDGFGLAEFVMPGRGRRFREASEDNLDRLCNQAVDALLCSATAPLLLSYSMGALLAFETAHRLQSAGRMPSALVVCALDAPHHLPTRGGVHRLPLPGLRDHLAALGGTPREVLDDLGVLACFEPAIRSDYRLLEAYRCDRAEPLRCPIVAIAGTRDTQTHAEGVAAWSSLTTGQFTALWVDDGHFFIDAHARAWRHCVEVAASRPEHCRPHAC